MSNAYYIENKPQWCANFGSKLQAAIRASGYSQSEVAEKLGITEAMLSRYIHGISIPSTYRTCQLADVVGCDIRDLVSTISEY